MESAASLIDECKAIIEEIQQAIQCKQWRRIATLAELHAARLAALQGKNPTLAAMKHLELMHRRTMRSLGFRMQSLRDEIEQLDLGERRLRRGREMLEDVYGRQAPHRRRQPETYRGPASSGARNQ